MSRRETGDGRRVSRPLPSSSRSPRSPFPVASSRSPAPNLPVSMTPAFARATGMMASSLRNEVIANNLATSTRPHSSGAARIRGSAVQTVQSPAVVGTLTEPMPAIQIGGARASQPYSACSTGAVRETSRSLDLAIEGEGFFRCRCLTVRVAYTRDGSWHLRHRHAGPSSGYTVVPGIKIPTNSSCFHLRHRRRLVQDGADTASVQELGRIELARFMNPSGCRRWAKPLRRNTRPAPPPPPFRRTTAWDACSRAIRGKQRRDRAGDGRHDRPCAATRSNSKSIKKQRRNDADTQRMVR